MATLLGLVSDVHATPGPLAAALELLRREGAERLLCLGDIAGYGDDLAATVGLLRDADCAAILGNHDAWYVERPHPATDPDLHAWFAGLPVTLDESIEGQRLHAVHASPPESLMRGIRLLDEVGTPLPDEWAHWGEELRDLPCDLLAVGHTHQVFAERLGGVRVVNPGSTCFNGSCALVEFPSLEVRLLPVPGVKFSRSWSWRGGWKNA